MSLYVSKAQEITTKIVYMYKQRTEYPYKKLIFVISLTNYMIKLKI